MKKILAMVLTLCLLCCGVALADNTTINQDSTSQTADTTVSYTVAENESYIVTIPSAVTLENKKGSLSGAVSVRLQTPSFNVSGKTITVKLTSTANDFNLVNGNNQITYTLKAGGVMYKVDDTLLSWTYGENTDQTLALVANAFDYGSLPAGDYTDTLTFTVSVTGGSSENDSNAGGIAGDVESPKIDNN